MTIAAVTGTQTATTAGLTQTTAASTSGTQTSGSSSSALGSLTTNFTNFLKLLMTQLQNQDPTSPMDTNEFTSELVQFTSVEQQINTNTSLTRLIELTQAGEVMQASSMIGKTINVESDQLSLQNGSSAIRFTAPSAQKAQVTVYNDTGVKLWEDSVEATKGSNTWSWDGRDATGQKVPDGSYKVAVTGVDANNATAALPFTVVSTATGVSSENNAVKLELGALTVPFSAVRSVAN